MISSDSAVRNCVVTVSSKNPDNSLSLEARFAETIARLTKRCVSDDGATDTPQVRLLIALSGGVDSVVLLCLAAGLEAQKFCKVRAIYVDHGLQMQSVEWGDHCAGLCESLGVGFERVTVKVDLQSGLSPEAAARDARYSALKNKLGSGEYLCTAHHADDQAETLLLQLFRGAGINGLASMPEVRRFGPGYLARPLLQNSQSEIIEFATRQQLTWCDDPSNVDPRYDRNYLRHELLPLMQKRWPRAALNISRSAAHCAEALTLTGELAEQDAPALQRMANRLSVARLQSLAEVRQKNLLRHWISSQGFQVPSTVQLRQLLSDLVDGKTDGQGLTGFGNADVARYQDELFIAKRGAFDPLPDFDYQWQQTDVPLFISELDWHLDATAHARLKPYIGKALQVRNRRGGERWRPDPAGQSTSVKSLLQQRRVPPWLRSRVLLVFHDDVLIDLCGPDFTL